MVGTAGFEPATPCPPDKYATRLRYAPSRVALDLQRVCIINQKRVMQIDCAELMQNIMRI